MELQNDNYKELSQDSIGSKLDLTLLNRRENYLMNFAPQLSTVGSMFLKIHSFLVVQMHQDIRIITSMKKGTWRRRLIL
jgi:hypothetical protein